MYPSFTKYKKAKDAPDILPVKKEYFDFEFLLNSGLPVGKVLEQIFQGQLDKYFPEKVIKYSNRDLPFITSDIKYYDRRVKREYRKHCKSDKYLQLKDKYDRKFQTAAKNYLQKNVTELKESNPGKSFSILKRMGAPPGSCNDEGTFTLQNHLEQNLSTEDSIEQIAQYFVQISQ